MKLKRLLKKLKKDKLTKRKLNDSKKLQIKNV